MTATWNTYPDTLKFKTAGEMCRFIEKHPEVLMLYRSTESRIISTQK